VGVATQDPELRRRFAGKPEHVERFFRFIAQEFREHMARLGFRTVDEMVGRVERLDFEPAVGHWKTRGLDFRRILAPPEGGDKTALRCVRAQDHAIQGRLDFELMRQAQAALDSRQPVHLAMPIRNIHRAVGATLSGEIVRRYGPQGLPDETIRLDFQGSAGQSLGAFLAPGVTIRVAGDANDYLGKGMSGGRIILVPPFGAAYAPHENIIVGTVVLYGATGGEVFVSGIAGERFGVRNSGATAVVEGVGDHGCEYMTGGLVVVLGSTGYNFAAGMSGGVAYVYDESELFGARCNFDMVDLESVWAEEDKRQLRTLVEKHFEHTRSPRAHLLLENWESHVPLFVKVMPIEYRKVLERMRLQEDRDTETVSATEEVYRG
jgi:glutamate synthase domain-containing protein 3